MSEQDLFGEVPKPTSRSQQPRGPVSQPLHTWFFALRPSAADAARIHAVTGKLLTSHGISGKRIDPERLHVTLDLVGHDVDNALVTAACSAAEKIRFPVIDVEFDAAMTFSTPSGPLVLLGSNGLGGVRELRTVLGCALAEHGFSPPRTYEPHMTLCYDPRHRMARTTIEPIAFRAVEFSLIKSHIGYSRHEVLNTWALSN